MFQRQKGEKSYRKFASHSLIKIATEVVKYSIGGIVNNIIIAMCGVRWGLTFWGEHMVSYIIV